MAQRKSLAWTELKVGLFILLGFAALTYAIISIGGPASFWGKKITITAYFNSASGLRPGNDVWLDGLLVGKVEEVGLNPNPSIPGRVAVKMKIDSTYNNNIRKDSVVGIESNGLLGDKTIQLSSGSDASEPVGDGGIIQGTEVGGIPKIIQGTDEIIGNFNVLSKNLTTISENVITLSENVNKGQGTLGKLLTNPEIHDNLNKSLVELDQLIADIRSGPGTAGKLVSDDEMYLRFLSLLSRMENIVVKVERGEGTAGKLINDPALFDKMTSVLDKMESITTRIDRGEGSLGKIMRDDGFYNDLRKTMGDLSGLIVAIQDGDGTTGRLINDPTLFNSMNVTLSEVQKFMYDVRQNPKKYLTIQFRFF
jgi:phospholipid/cholesterol/gamma-HCH transport system substrate-binding protein